MFGKGKRVMGRKRPTFIPSLLANSTEVSDILATLPKATTTKRESSVVERFVADLVFFHLLILSERASSYVLKVHHPGDRAISVDWGFALRPCQCPILWRKGHLFRCSSDERLLQLSEEGVTQD